MQTAAQVDQYPAQPVQPGQKKTNGLIKASFIIGLILFVLGMLNAGFINLLVQSLIHKGAWSSMQYGIFSVAISLGVFNIPGILGLILGIVGFRRMVKEPPPYDYFTAIAGIALCFLYGVGLITNLLSIISNAVLAPLLFR